MLLPVVLERPVRPVRLGLTKNNNKPRFMSQIPHAASQLPTISSQGGPLNPRPSGDLDGTSVIPVQPHTTAIHSAHSPIKSDVAPSASQEAPHHVVSPEQRAYLESPEFQECKEAVLQNLNAFCNNPDLNQADPNALIVFNKEKTAITVLETDPTQPDDRALETSKSRAQDLLVNSLELWFGKDVATLCYPNEARNQPLTAGGLQEIRNNIEKFHNLVLEKTGTDPRKYADAVHAVLEEVRTVEAALENPEVSQVVTTWSNYFAQVTGISQQTAATAAAVGLSVGALVFSGGAAHTAMAVLSLLHHSSAAALGSHAAGALGSHAAAGALGSHAAAGALGSYAAAAANTPTVGSAVRETISFMFCQAVLAAGGATIGGVAGGVAGLASAASLEMPGEVAGVAFIGGAVLGAPIGAQVALGASLTGTVMNTLNHIALPSFSHASAALAAAPLAAAPLGV